MTNDGGGAPQLPSDSELTLLRELGKAGELTVRELHERVRDDWPIGLTTVLKLAQRMTEKGLLSRRKVGRAHRYSPRVDLEVIERRLVRDFLSRTFEGSVTRLLHRALPEEPADAEELEEIRRLLDDLDD